MGSKRKRLGDLAAEVGLEGDEALVTVWDMGLDHYSDIDDLIRPSDLRAITVAFGKVPDRDKQKISYWARAWGLDLDGVRARLKDDFGVVVPKNARTLPKGVLKKLNKATNLVLDSRVLQAASSELVSDTVVAEEEQPPALEWRCAGRSRDIRFLSEREVRDIHDALCNDFQMSSDPIEPSGVRDPALLESACQRPRTSLGTTYKYTTVESAASALLHSLVHNHPFHNGNKRTALVSMLVFMDENRMILTCDQQSLFKFVLQVSQHRLVDRSANFRADREVLAMNSWICANARQKELGERVVKWKEFARNLQNLGCVVGKTLPGNRVKVSRSVPRPRRGLLPARERTHTVTAHKRNGGSEIDVDQIATIRRDLQLDDIHGYDSAHFYGDDRSTPDRFIAEYRTILKRLARL